ncbi:hypothetical protein BYT27DRAFT_6681020 [Phlegmacium glaucopus]|nr:hypothetical protein BYT27DRAFT_6681020 [Phlegmacium glaucopus]
MYLVGGYKMTEDQVLEWCKPRGLKPTMGLYMSTVNRYLRNQNIPLRILACDYEREPIFLLVTNRKEDPTATPGRYELFEESDAARNIKEQMGIPGVEFITVANPYHQ